MKEVETEERRRMLHAATGAQKRSLINIISFNFFISSIFLAFFSYSYTIHFVKLEVLHTIQDNSPYFLSRYTDIFLSYQFLRERIMN
jgi:hypothetical protein